MSFNSANLFTVEEVRSNFTFVVPEFQRGYAWNEEQWQALWDDVVSTAERSGSHHYGGSIMLSNAEPGGTLVELIDGQQRMTSIALMLAALGAQGFPIQFRDNEPLQTYYDYYALKRSHLGPSLKQHVSFYSRNIADAALFFSAQAQGVADEATRKMLVDVVLKRIKLFVLGIHQDFDVHVAFETINNRGKPLSTLEKLKNRLLYVLANAKDATDVVAAKAEVHRCWKQVYQSLGAGTELLEDDEFLRAHAMGWFRHERRENWLQDQLFEQSFSARKPVDSAEVLAYVHSLQVAAACWHLLHNPASLPPRVEQRILWLKRTSSSTSKPLLLWALIRLSQQYPAVLQTPGRDGEWTAPLAELIHQAERFSVLVLLANDRQSNVGQTDLNNAAYALAHPGERINHGNSRVVPPLDAAAALTYMSQFLAAAVYNVRDWDLIEDDSAPDSEKYLDPRFKRSGEFDADAVADAVAKRFRRRSGYYKWNLGKLLVYAWEEKLRGERGLPEKKSWEKFAWDGSVEHIYPQTPDGRWSDSILAKGKGKDRIHAAVVNSLGNLLLLSVPHNAEASNAGYLNAGGAKGKRELYRAGSYSEAQVAEACNKWTVVQIAARGIAMLRHAQASWNFELVADDAPLITWLPLLFGEHADRIRKGCTGVEITNQALAPWVKKFMVR
jgi:hypothetical protein